MSEQNLAFSYNNVHQTYISIYETYMEHTMRMPNVHQHIPEYARVHEHNYPHMHKHQKDFIF